MGRFLKRVIYLQVKDTMKVYLYVAVKIAEEIFSSGLAGIEYPDDLRAFIKDKKYIPVYK